MDQVAKEQKSRVCPACGYLTPDDVAECIYCGHAPPEVVEARREEARLRNFAGALFARSSPFTFLFLGMNLCVFILMWMAGGMGAMSTNLQVLIGFGAKQNALIDEHNQYWRLVTSIFIHIGFIHLLLNNYVLWILGREIERLYGSSRFVILYLSTGIAGSLSSYLFNPNTSAGASGALFGLFGVMAAFAFRYRKEIPNTVSRSIRQRVVPLIIINLVFGFSVQMIDNSAHVGGLLAGIAMTFVIPYKRPKEKITPLAWRVLMLLCMVIIFGSAIMAFSHYDGPKPRFSNLLVQPGAAVKPYFERMREANISLGKSLTSFKKILNKKDESADTTEAMKAAESGILSATAAPLIEDESNRYRQRLIDLLTSQKEIIQRFSESKQSDRDQTASQVDKLNESYNKFNEDYFPWLREFLKENGYELQKQPSDEQRKDPAAQTSHRILENTYNRLIG